MTDKFEKWLESQIHQVNVWGMTQFNGYDIDLFYRLPFEMQQGVYQRYLREEHGVLIYVYRNGSGYLWAMSMADSGTDLGWSDFTGDCELSKTFTTHKKAMKDAIDVEMNYGCYHKLCEDRSKLGHWDGYGKYVRTCRIKARVTELNSDEND